MSEDETQVTPADIEKLLANVQRLRDADKEEREEWFAAGHRWREHQNDLRNAEYALRGAVEKYAPQPSPIDEVVRNG